MLGARLGEETLTDLLVLDMLPHQTMNTLSIYHPTKQEESRFGADLLVCIRYPDGSGRRLAVQAKKLYPTGRYAALGHSNASGTLQIDKLDKFARTWGAIPVYLLYNHLDQLPQRTHHWHCCRDYDAEQLGCTLVPSWRIRQAIGSRGRRTFPAIHEQAPARPWRCVFDCDRPLKQTDALRLSQPEPEVSDDRVFFHQRRPDWIQTGTDQFDFLFDIEEPVSIENLNRLFAHLATPRHEVLGDAELTYPRRVLAVDLVGSKMDPDRE